MRCDLDDLLRAHGEDQEDYHAALVVLMELVGNAISYAPAGPIAVKLEWLGERPLLSVSDRGSGFTPNDELPPPEQPSGRGLFLVRQLAAAPAVDVSSLGCTVSVELALRRRAGSSRSGRD